MKTKRNFHLIGYSEDCGEDSLMDYETLAQAKAGAKRYLQEKYWNDDSRYYWRRIIIWNLAKGKIETCYDRNYEDFLGNMECEPTAEEREMEKRLQFARNPQLSLF